MIRRDATDIDGTPSWLLIRQTDHARLAFALADGWRSAWFSPPEVRDEVLAAILHHDDGWFEWERCPEVDPASGKPYAFTEMPLATGLSIWRGSIDTCRTIGPLAGYMVAGHFSALLRHYDSWKTSPEKKQLAKAFLDEFASQRAEWLADWQRADSATKTREIADQAVAELQFFDALSLWFCCCEESAPRSFSPPAGPPITITPVNRTAMIAEPWPYPAATYHLSTTGWPVPAQRYRSTEELQAVPRTERELAWILQQSP